MEALDPVAEAKGVVVGRAFTAGASVLFLIGSVIALTYGVIDLRKAEANSHSTTQ